MNIKRFIYKSKWYIEFFFLFLLPVTLIMTFLKLWCWGINLIPDRLADKVFDIMKIDYKD